MNAEVTRTRSPFLAAAAHEYAQTTASPPEREVLAKLRQATVDVAHSEMQIGADQGRFMSMLVKLIGARRCIEVGTYTGYSALAVALALPKDGKLIACDVSEEWANVGKPFWREAGVDSKIDLRIQPALETLDGLLRDGEAGKFDFAFIDADKPNYAAYYEKLIELIRPGGVIAVDNTLAVAGTPIVTLESTNARALRAFNELVRRDERVEFAMLTIGEGLTLLRKRD